MTFLIEPMEVLTTIESGPGCGRDRYIDEDCCSMDGGDACPGKTW